MMDATATVTPNRLVALTETPCKWITVIRQGETQAAVARYVNDWPVFTVSDYGMFIVAIPGDQTWLGDRLASGLFYAKVHDTFADAEADAMNNADLIR